jgi:hypothetical protein
MRNQYIELGIKTTAEERTVEDAVGDKTARVVGDSQRGLDVHGLAFVALDVAIRPRFSLHLVRIDRLYIASVVLIVVGEFVVEEDGAAQRLWNVELEGACRLLAQHLMKGCVSNVWTPSRCVSCVRTVLLVVGLKDHCGG